MFHLYPQTFIILWMPGIITLQEKGSTTSVRSIDTHLILPVTTLHPARTEDPGRTPITGVPGAAAVRALHIRRSYHVSVWCNRTLCLFCFLTTSGSNIKTASWMTPWLREACRWTCPSSTPPLWRACPRSAWWTWPRREQRRPPHIPTRREEPSVCQMCAVSPLI